ncbi:hypothetical protein QBC46DRAFT_388079 [Diplogelasinospora grovesii]|uniref:CFEM domain-containing protein n=1 Tax=Diplogelasinospora grovesii TaxID=303347 RepID=A0AAN6N561_9PEZI|nr:hypothetical protein QBC46DRAFT_388079 [Diplogelasinospora grovesii]
MKTRHILAIAFIFFSASNAQYVGACATACFVDAMSAAGCGLSDIACLCGDHQSAIGEDTENCMSVLCRSGELFGYQAAQSTYCAIYSEYAWAVPDSNTARQTSFVSAPASATAPIRVTPGPTTRRADTAASTTVGAINTGQQTGGLTTGSIVGIAVGGLVGAGVLVGAGFYFGRRRKSLQSDEQKPGGQSQNQPTVLGIEADSRQKYELENTFRPAHAVSPADGHQRVYELPSQSEL